METPAVKSPALHRKALLMLVLANAFWGLSFPTVKALSLLHAQLLPEASLWFATVQSIAPRFLIATVLMGALLGRRVLTITASELRQGLLLGAFATAGMLLQCDGLQYMHASVSAFLTQLYAVLIPLWLAFRRRRNPGTLVWSCCALVLLGAGILGRFDPSAMGFGRGEWETLASSLFFMAIILLLDQPRYAANRGDRVSFVMFASEMVFAWIIAGVMTPSVEALWLPWTNVPWLVMTLVLAVFCTIGAFWLMNAWQPCISATEAGLVYCLEPVFGTLAAMVLPALYSVWAGLAYANESADWRLWVGGGLVTAANVLLQLRPPAK